MSTGAAGSAGAFKTSYTSALGDYLADPSERCLRAAYELGREAVRRELGVLDLAIAHQDALAVELAAVRDLGEAQEVTRAGGEFFLESLVSFEMVQRGVKETWQALRLERHQARLSRQLSTFLADASLAVNVSDSLEEILQLVSERARELIDAQCCITTVALALQPRATEAASYPEADRRWTQLFRWLDRVAIYDLIRSNGGSVRMAGEQLARLPPFHVIGDPPLRGWLAASLSALNGAELGAIQVFDKRDGNFTREDEAALVHLAQLASAAIERTRLYQDRT